jgi:tetratricopeptide (TPR) repeat protein
MKRARFLTGLLLLLAMFAPASMAQLGKSILIPAGSEEDHQLTAINAAEDPAAKLKLLEDFAKAHTDDEFQVIADEQFVNFYLNAKQYDKVFEYGEKLWAVDPDNYANGVNLVRAGNEKGDFDRVFDYGEKATAILQRYKAAPAPEGTAAEAWEQQKTQKLEQVKENQDYVEKSMLIAAYQPKDEVKKADLLVRYAKDFPDSPNAEQVLSVAAVTYQQAQGPQKMVDLANGVLAKDPNNLGMLLLLADYYSEKGTQLDKAEEYAKKVAAICDAAKKPDSVSDEDWKKQNGLKKGLALSALGQVNLQKKENLAAVKNLTSAAPLVKSDPGSYARNQYRLGFAYLNLKRNADAKQAFTDAASVNTPYKGPAEEKLKELGASKAGAGRKTT